MDETEARKDLGRYNAAEPGEPKGKKKRHLSKLAIALHASGQREMKVDASSVLGKLLDHDGSGICDIVFRLNKKKDDKLALVAAHAHIARQAKHAEGGEDAFRSDPAVTNDEGTIQALFRACRDPDDTSQSIFITPGWMRDAFDTWSLNGLVNLYNECIARMLGLPLAEELDLDAHRDMLVAAFDTVDLPELLLAKYSREVLTNLLCLFALRWDTERLNAVDTLKAALEGAEGWEKQAQEIVDDWHRPEPELEDKANDELTRLAKERDQAIKRAELAEKVLRDEGDSEG